MVSSSVAKIFKQAPLPFIGQKRYFIKSFCEVLNDNIQGLGDEWTIVDVFGGSGLLSHQAKRLKPHAKVIYNDFDNYAQRLKHIDDTNRLRQQLAEVLKGIPIKNKIDPKTHFLVIETIKNFDGFIDIDCVWAWLLFSGNQAESLNQIYTQPVLYNRLRKSDYPDAKDYLTGVEVVSKSFDELLPEYVNNEKTLLILDPPYLFSEQISYRKTKDFGLVSFIKLMELIRPPFIMFSNYRSEILDYFDYQIKRNDERFLNYKYTSISAPLNNVGFYRDNMIYKF
ncbi:hypothetical protein GY065_10330 [Snodgrassella sp. ESL0323]|uniref:hypothetical protein n=1 Tax=Snodgrassella sp. ESL0323 TaxID=2705034 RepID=UPI001581FCF2|nr:hypothetical protein [Snodgrassella sp. ESL0323]NUF79297.1 hypothetical protein [Snodgrassella sp. ESL0323]